MRLHSPIEEHAIVGLVVGAGVWAPVGDVVGLVVGAGVGASVWVIKATLTICPGEVTVPK